jgi:hypothetical protein
MTRSQINNIKIHANNVEKYKNSLVDLIGSKDHIIKELNRYPVEVCFVDFRTVLCKKKELHNLIKILGFRIKEYEMLQE